MITKESAEKFVRGIFTEVWCDRNKEAVSKYYHPDFLGLLHGEEEFRYADVLKRVDYSIEHFNRPTCEFHDIFTADEHRIVARVSMQVPLKDAQKQESLSLMVIMEMKDGKMHRQWTLSNIPYRYKDWD